MVYQEDGKGGSAESDEILELFHATEFEDPEGNVEGMIIRRFAGGPAVAVSYCVRGWNNYYLLYINDEGDEGKVISSEQVDFDAGTMLNHYFGKPGESGSAGYWDLDITQGRFETVSGMCFSGNGYPDSRVQEPAQSVLDAISESVEMHAAFASVLGME